jgi:peptidoglycan/LPS O-acetylase OafA/YrhL
MSPRDTEGTDRKRDLDGLRGVAVLMTIFLHYVCRSGFFGDVGPPRISQLLNASWAGVDIFFVLSGFLIGGIIIDNRDAENFYAAFYRRRALRILPLAFLTIAFSYLVLPLVTPSVVVGAHVPPYAYLLFINNFWTALGHPGYIPLGPMWSLAIEEQFYLIAPTFLRSVGPRTRNATLMAVIVISPLLRASHTGLSGWEFTPFRLDGFACGILVAGLLRDTRYREVFIRNRGIIGASAAGLVGVDLLFASSPHYSLAQRVAFGISLNSLAAAGVISSLQVSPGSGLARILSRQWLVACGKYSYFLYLMHVPILLYTLGAYVGGSFVPHVATALGITFFCAWASWRFLESRLIHLGKRYLYSARSPRLQLSTAIGRTD